MYFNGMLMLDLWDSDAEYAIFDDFEDWSRFYNYKQFLGAQKEFILTDKYIKKKSVVWGKPSIVLSNEYPNFRDNVWIRDNCFIVELHNPLF